MSNSPQRWGFDLIMNHMYLHKLKIYIINLLKIYEGCRTPLSAGVSTYIMHHMDFHISNFKFLYVIQLEARINNQLNMSLKGCRTPLSAGVSAYLKHHMNYYIATIIQDNMITMMNTYMNPFT